MEVIDGTWIRARLMGRRGEQANLAAHMGISADKLNKVLSGKRNVQPQEVPLVLSFFGAEAPLSENERALIDAYRAASPDRRRLLEEMTRVLLATSEALGPEDA